MRKEYSRKWEQPVQMFCGRRKYLIGQSRKSRGNRESAEVGPLAGAVLGSTLGKTLSVSGDF